VKRGERGRGGEGVEGWFLGVDEVGGE